ncbi:MAG TPA: hypothetical protein VK831_02300 [Candidatus Deferrimicrobiaceae bacterium]|nr:hypothetical protein [Candidatus Deferrimicrobiaceae bacterium]
MSRRVVIAAGLAALALVAISLATARAEDADPFARVLDALAVVVGVVLVLRANLSAIRTFVLPRATNDLITRIVFRALRRAFDLAASPRLPYPLQDRLMAYFGPFALMALPVVWLVVVGAGYTLIFWGTGVRPMEQALVDSGSSLLTLGFDRPDGYGAQLIAFSEATIGLGLIALLIAYLPTIYGGFSRRELLVSLLETRAGSPPSPVALLTRLWKLDGLHQLHELLGRWELWFAELEETHTSLTALVHFRSQSADRSWVNAAGAVLDACALVSSPVQLDRDAQVDLTLRSGRSTLRRITTVFHLPFDPEPGTEGPVRIDRETFDRALAELELGGVPLVADLEAAWRDFRACRASYDEPLARLEDLTVAPAPWWSQRAPASAVAGAARMTD